MKVNKPDVLPKPQLHGLEASKGGAAFEVIFNDHWPKILAIVARLVGDSDEAEDLSLEAFFQLYQKLSDLQDSERLGGWLYRVATNLGLNAIRARRRRSGYETRAALNGVEQTPEHFAEQHERREQVRTVLAEMDPSAARLLTLRSAGLSYRELASTVGKPVHSIGNMLSRAEKQFEKKYRMRYGDPG